MDYTSSPAHSSVSVVTAGGGSSSNIAIEDVHLSSIQDQKEEAQLVLKAALMAALNKEVKTLDEDNWKFEGPRSRMELISRPGGFLNKKQELAKNKNLVPSK